MAIPWLIDLFFYSLTFGLTIGIVFKRVYYYFGDNLGFHVKERLLRHLRLSSVEVNCPLFLLPTLILDY